ncbi:MAG: ABC transporter permease [Polyangiaceae bacterium]|jgi:putative ABC transport system permease protein
MTFAQLAVRNFARNRLRVTLTLFAVALAVVAFLLLRTVMWAWTEGAHSAPSDRIVTRHRITMSLPLPRHYVDEVRGAPHVRAATWASGFGGKSPQHATVLFGSAAIDAATFFAVYDEMKLPSGQLEAFQHDRQGAIIGDAIAAKVGWKLGDKVTLESGFFPGDWQFTVDGIYTPSAKSVNGSNFLIHWEYVNESLSNARGDKDTVGLIISRLDDPSHAADVSLELDGLFENREAQTLSQDERTLSASLLGMFTAVLRAMDVLAAVILVIMTLILGNTIAMGVRERTGEYGVLLAIGFLPSHIARWIVAESFVTAIVGGALGALLAWPFINLFLRRFVDENVGSFFPYFGLDAGHALLGVGLSGVLGAAAGAIPAWRASRLRVVDAVRRVG